MSNKSSILDEYYYFTYGAITPLFVAFLVMYLGKIVESGSSEDVYENPSNPYTQSLSSFAYWIIPYIISLFSFKYSSMLSVWDSGMSFGRNPGT